MILEKRTTRWIPKATPPKQRETTSSDTAGEGTGGKDKDKPTEKNPAAGEEEGEREPVTVNGDADGHDPERKTRQNANADIASGAPAESPVPKSGPVAYVAVQQTSEQQMSPTSAQETRKLTYNPITHAPSMYESKQGYLFTCLAVMPPCLDLFRFLIPAAVFAVNTVNIVDILIPILQFVLFVLYFAHSAGHHHFLISLHILYVYATNKHLES